MRHGRLSRIIGIALLVLPAAPFTGLAQEQAQPKSRKHTHYRLVDLGTFGGPNSNVNCCGPVLNDHGTVVGGADTADWDPICGCPAFHALKYRDGSVTDLGTLPGGGNFSFADTINSSGLIGGASDNGLIDPVTGIEAFVATIWKKNGEIVNLGTFGGSFSQVFDINDRGQVLGAAENDVPDPFDFFGLVGLPSPTQWHAALWQNGTMQDLGTLGGPGSGAGLINERGQVAGASFTDSIVTDTGYPTIHPFLWQDGQMVDLGSLGGALAFPTGLNERGQVAGFSSTAGEATNHAFLWAHGTMQDLGTLGGPYNFSEANAINDSTEITGHSDTVDGAIRGFRWKHGTMADLGPVGAYDCSNTGSIDANGTVAGWIYRCDGSGPSHAALWEEGRPGIDLNTLVPPGSGLELTEAKFINVRGEIAGAAILQDGDEHAILLIPRDGDDDDDATVATQNDVTPATASATNATHARLTPERLVELRSRFANRHHGFGLRPRTNVN